MRLIRFEKPVSPLQWQQLYARTPGLADRSYTEQLRAYCDDASQYAGAFVRELSPLGYEVCEVYTHVYPLQRAWARENGVPWPRTTWTKTIPMEQARRFKPDVLYSYDSRNLDAHWLGAVRRACPALKVVTGFIGSPSYDIDTFRQYDFLLTCTEDFVREFRDAGIATYYASHVFDAWVLSRLETPLVRRRDLVFSGAVWRDSAGHHEREAMLERLTALPNLEIYCPTASVSVLADLTSTAARASVYGMQRTLRALGVSDVRRRALPLIGKAATWKSMPMSQLNPRLRPYMRPPKYGLEMFALLREARICLNSVAFREAANMRLFEATGVGTCLLTSHRDNLRDLFDVDREIVTFASADECAEKALWLLENDAEREAISAAGQARTLANYSFENRARLMDELIRRHLH